MLAKIRDDMHHPDLEEGSSMEVTVTTTQFPYKRFLFSAAILLAIITGTSVGRRSNKKNDVTLVETPTVSSVSKTMKVDSTLSMMTATDAPTHFVTTHNEPQLENDNSNEDPPPTTEEDNKKQDDPKELASTDNTKIENELNEEEAFLFQMEQEMIGTKKHTQITSEESVEEPGDIELVSFNSMSSSEDEGTEAEFLADVPSFLTNNAKSAINETVVHESDEEEHIHPLSKMAMDEQELMFTLKKNDTENQIDLKEDFINDMEKDMKNSQLIDLKEEAENPEEIEEDDSVRMEDLQREIFEEKELGTETEDVEENETVAVEFVPIEDLQQDTFEEKELGTEGETVAVEDKTETVEHMEDEPETVVDPEDEAELLEEQMEHDIVDAAPEKTRPHIIVMPEEKYYTATTKCGDNGTLTGFYVAKNVIQACNGGYYTSEGDLIPDHVYTQILMDAATQARKYFDDVKEAGTQNTNPPSERSSTVIVDKKPDPGQSPDISPEQTTTSDVSTPQAPPGNAQPTDTSTNESVPIQDVTSYLADQPNTATTTECPTSANEDALEDYHGPSGEDEAIYEIYFSNPPKLCGTIVEIGTQDGDNHSKSHFFEHALYWKTVLIESNPNKFAQVTTNRPNSIKQQGAFCENGHLLFYEENGYNYYQGRGKHSEVISEQYTPIIDHAADTQAVPCISLAPIFKANNIRDIDILYIGVTGDVLAVIRQMDWTVRVNVWVIEMNGLHEDRDEVVRDVLYKNDYVKAEWDIKRWCNPHMMGNCMPNEVYLKRGYNPLSQDTVGRRLTERNRRLMARS